MTGIDDVAALFGDPASVEQRVRGGLTWHYAYAEVRTDPVGVRVYAGWYGLPVILNPNAVLVFGVIPQAVTPAP